MKRLPPILSKVMDLLAEEPDFLRDKKENEEPIRDTLLKNIDLTEEDLSDMRDRFKFCVNSKN